MSKVVQTTEAQADSLDTIVNKVFFCPKVGVHVGGGIHVAMPATWDGNGAIPPGWTRRAFPIYLLSAADAWFELPDNAVSLCASSGLLTGPEKASIASAGASRATVADPTENGTRSPKASAASAQVADAAVNRNEDATR